jgi:4-diphosphocytidyl-2-C-methyl-D-erythritol kinase
LPPRSGTLQPKINALKQTIRLRAFAKVNLGLKILGKRLDGFHEIRTVYQTLSLHDRLSLSIRHGSSEILVECDDPQIPTGPANLVHRACEAWRRARKIRVGIRASLKKNIPAKSGLGGASADAAVTLLGLERLTGDGLSQEARLRLAAQLGSDMPLFLWGGRVLGCGRGEEVYPMRDLPARQCLVVFPGFGVSTAEAYREADRNARMRLTGKAKNPNINGFGAWSHHSLQDWGPAENDFEQVVFARWPELASLKRQLIRAGAETASLTGSGSALFAVFVSARHLLSASKKVPAGWQKFRTLTLPRLDYETQVFA